MVVDATNSGSRSPNVIDNGKPRILDSNVGKCMTDINMGTSHGNWQKGKEDEMTNNASKENSTNCVILVDPKRRRMDTNLSIEKESIIVTDSAHLSAHNSQPSAPKNGSLVSLGLQAHQEQCQP